MKHTEWLANVTNNDATNAIARKAEIVPRTFARQVDRDHIDAENIIAIALAYGVHPVGALVDTEYLAPEWAEQIDPMRALRLVTEEQLADEVLRRMNLGVQIGGALDTPVDELAERRQSAARDKNDGTVKEWDESIPYSADDSPEETEERLNRGEDPID